MSKHRCNHDDVGSPKACKRNKYLKKPNNKLELNKKKLSPIHRLDDDCLVKIFMYLPVQKRLEVEKVCTRWKDVIKSAWYDIKELDYLNSDDIEIELDEESLTQSELEKMLERCGRYLINLRLSDDYDSKIINVIRDNCHNLIKLKLELQTYSDDNFLWAFNDMEKLQSIKIHFSGNILLNCLQSIHKNIEDIQFIARDIYHQSLNYHRNFQQLLSKFNCLRYLTMNRLELSYETIKTIGQMRSLIHLDLQNCYQNKKTSLVPLMNLSNLEYLDLFGIHIGNDVDDLIDGLAVNCVHLKHFDISWNLSLTKRGLMNICKMKNLEVLRMNYLTFQVNQQIGKFDKLKKLECNGFIGGVNTIIIGIIKNSPNLENFDIRNTPVTIHTLNNAIKITKKRKNNITLHLCVSRTSFENYDQFENTSPLLDIQCH
ncbi:hypothetical protein HCN44_006046 [Aphidius gifuensis]|uniref:F-box domain-containing protein n=1 Tax=Aphidius gifuensis TaxID=684658 RepID=A0A835CYB7_APHGI|nr:uncharacterized protein LOC122851208 [Aphidius gifuensis]KAF7997475.1 hypothetical protein HCN44_006046 [Aphidius gifuensis]